MDSETLKQYSYTALAPYWKIILGPLEFTSSGSETIQEFRNRLHRQIEGIKVDISVGSSNEFQVDITSRLESIANIDKSLDYPNITEYRIGESTLEINDFDRAFDPKFLGNNELESNIYQIIDGKSSGYRIPVKIYAGFIDPSQPTRSAVYSVREAMVFKGEIHQVARDINEKTVEITCTDEPQDVREELIKDFGLEKTVRLQGYSSSTGGEYPLPHDIAPASEGSVSGARSDAINMSLVNSLSTEGVLSDTDFVVEETLIKTEKHPANTVRSDDFLIGDQPAFNLKAPYRDKSIRFLINEILGHYDISEADSDIELPDKKHIDAVTGEEKPFFSSNGRVGYDFEHEDLDIDDDDIEGGPRFNNDPLSSKKWRWSGFVTDCVVNSAGNRFLFLYSSKQTANTTSRVIEYNKIIDKYDVRYTISGTQKEYWSLVATDDFNEIYVLGTDAAFLGITPFGSYDSAEQDRRPTIIKLTRPNIMADFDTETTFIDNRDTHRPQLAQYYHVGFGVPGGPSDVGNNRLGSLPFSKRLFIHNNNLYYLWSRRRVFGVAKKSLSGGSTEAIFSTDRDTYRDGYGYNHAGCSFFIKGNTLYATVTYLDYGAANSRYDIFSVSIS